MEKAPPLSSQNWIKGQSQRTHNKGIPSIGKSASFSTVWLSLLCIFNMFKLYISRTFFPSLTLVFSLTPMQWFFRTRPSSGTGPYHLISNISILWQSWNRFRLFTPFTAMAIAPVEAHYSRDLVGDSHHRQKLLEFFLQKTNIPYYGLPGLGLNAGVALMNLTRWKMAQWISYLYRILFTGLILKSGMVCWIFWLKRLRELPGGGFTEVARFLWEKHRWAP